MRCTYPGCNAAPATVGDEFLAQNSANWKCPTHWNAPERKTRSIREIAADIRRTWPAPYFGAVPYIAAMASLDTVADNFGADPAPQILAYFLGNAKNWRGEDARRIKAEINQLLKRN